MQLLIVLVLAGALGFADAAKAQYCGGDGDLDCQVTVDEVVTMVNTPGEAVADILSGIDTALTSCGNAFCTESTHAAFSARGGVEQLTVTGATPNTPLTLYDSTGRKVVTLVTDDWGQASFAYLPNEYGVFETGPEVGIPTTDGVTIKRGTYVIRNESVTPVESSGGVRVLGLQDIPDDSFYESQQVGAGFQYLKMRDGVLLSVTVRFPGTIPPVTYPYPTVIEYSGYGTSNPNAEDAGSAIAHQLGYATVGVNMRGSGCSGGVFDIFNPAQQADGYDIVEIIARQPWVRNGKVGMVGLSYSGIAQLYVASTRPPSLAAITSMSVIDDPWRQQWPGGVYNDGFTREWLAGRDAASSPSGTSWVAQQIAAGDSICGAHQTLRNQNPDFQKFGRAIEHYYDDNDARRLGQLVRNIEVPVYLTGAWQDEQTGSRFATMLDDFVSTDKKKFIVFNGRHPDGYSPLSLSRWWEFLEFYVAKRTPYLHSIFRQVVSDALSDAFRVPGLMFEPERFPRNTPYATALAQYEAEPAVRVLFEVGGDHAVPNAPVARFEQSFASWPPPAQPRLWYLGDNGSLLDQVPQSTATDQYRHDAAAGPVSYSNTSANDFLFPEINHEWPPLAPGLGLSYLSEPLGEAVVVAGNGGYANLWFASDSDRANVEVTLTEVRSDGTETIINSGVFNTGYRNGIDESFSDTFLVEYTYKAADYAPLVPNELVEVKVPIQPFAHPFHAGSRLRILIHTPGRDQPLWKYENPDYGREVLHKIAHGPEHVSYLLLPVVSGITVPQTLPGCNALRGQICRDYVPFVNETAS